MLRSSCFNFHVHFRSFCLTLFTQMPSLIRYGKVTYENCGTQTTKPNLARNKKRCSVGLMYCTQCPNFSTTSQADLNYHIAKKHATPRVKSIHKCKICSKEFSGFYELRQHKTSEHGNQIKSAEFDVNNLLESDDGDLKVVLQACQ